MVLETRFETAEGSVALIDFMPYGKENSSVVRRIEGRRGRVRVRMHLTMRFDYGSSTPWVTQLDDGSGLSASRLVLISWFCAPRWTCRDRTMPPSPSSTWARTRVSTSCSPGGSRICCRRRVSTWVTALADTERFWAGWSADCKYQGPWRTLVLRSLLTLKALTFAPTGGIAAALTTSLPEQLGGTRNWDYRYCWLRDATLTLVALMEGGYTEEARAWRSWLQRAVAGNPDELQIMYGLAGERQLLEWSPAWLPGYQGAAPVRIGNAASEQLQLDVYGEVASALHIARKHGLSPPHASWTMQAAFLAHLETIWDQPDDGIWEVRGGRRQFTHSKVMAWVAVDRSIRDAEAFDVPAPLDHWRELRDRMHAEICAKGYDPARNTFTQSFGSPELDAALLLIPQVGFLPPDDKRVIGTVEAIERELLVDGFVLRYRTEAGSDGLPAGEGAFLPCSFWLVDAYALLGRHADAEALFERLGQLANDVGLLAEEYDPKAKRQVGNFPQAFSHLALVEAALQLRGDGPPARS